MENITDKEFEGGTWVALVLPSGEKGVGIIVHKNGLVHFVGTDGFSGTVRLNTVKKISEITIDWGEDT